MLSPFRGPNAARTAIPHRIAPAAGLGGPRCRWPFLLPRVLAVKAPGNNTIAIRTAKQQIRATSMFIKFSRCAGARLPGGAPTLRFSQIGQGSPDHKTCPCQRIFYTLAHDCKGFTLRAFERAERCETIRNLPDAAIHDQQQCPKNSSHRFPYRR